MDRFHCCDECDFDLCKKCLEFYLFDEKHHSWNNFTRIHPHILHEYSCDDEWMCDG